MAVLFNDDSFKFPVKGKRKVKSWIRLVIETEGYSCGDLNIVFTSDEKLRKTNLQYLNHDYYTDIITFDYCHGNNINGDIFISAERVIENASSYNVDVENEMLRVLIHGVLHLIGYADSSQKEKEIMRTKENDCLAIFYSTK